MVQFIGSNPVTDQIAANTARELAQAQAMGSLIDARDARVQRKAQDAAGRALAGVFAEDDPAPRVAPQAAAPAVPDASAGMMANVDGSLPAPAAPSPISTVSASDPMGDRFKRAIKIAGETEGGGQLAMQLAGQYAQHQKGREAARQKHDDKVLSMLGEGDVEGAKQYATMYGLTHLQPMFDNPRAIVTVSSIGKLAKNLGIKDEHAGAFTGKVLESMSAGRPYQQALQDGFAAMKSVPGQIKHITQDDAGNVYGITAAGEGRPISGVRARSAAGLSRGGDGKEPAAVTAAKYKITELQRAINPSTGRPFTEEEAIGIVMKANERDIGPRDRLTYFGQLSKQALDDKERAAAESQLERAVAIARGQGGKAAPPSNDPLGLRTK